MSMETDSPVVYHGTSESRFSNKDVERVLNTELTPEEKKILRECSRESLIYRCVPLMIAGITATQLAVRKGIITPHRTWGSIGPMMGATFLGWVIGKFSYKSKCEEKFLHLENSTIADAIRKSRGYVMERHQSEFSKSKFSQEDAMFKDDPSFSYYPDSDFHSSTGSLNLDVDKNIQYSGLDDLGRPSTDREFVQTSEETEPIKKFTTYEELRHKNREEYERSQRPLSSRLNVGPSAGQKPWSNVDTTPPRRYNSDFGEDDRRRTDIDSWDKAKLL